MGKPDAVAQLVDQLARAEHDHGVYVEASTYDLAALLAYVAELEHGVKEASYGIGVDYEEGYPRFAPFTHEIQEAVTPDDLNNIVKQQKLDKARVAELEGALRDMVNMVYFAAAGKHQVSDTCLTMERARAALTGGEKGGG